MRKPGWGKKTSLSPTLMRKEGIRSLTECPQTWIRRGNREAGRVGG